MLPDMRTHRRLAMCPQETANMAEGCIDGGSWFEKCNWEHNSFCYWLVLAGRMTDPMLLLLTTVLSYQYVDCADIFAKLVQMGAPKHLY